MSEKKKYLVAGSGISGIAAAKLLVQAGEDTILYDGNTKIVEEELRAKLGEAAGIPIVLGELPQELVEELTACIISPGIPLRVPFVQQLQSAGVPIWSEIELAYRCGNGRIAAITGTNGGFCINGRGSGNIAIALMQEHSALFAQRYHHIGNAMIGKNLCLIHGFFNGVDCTV